MATTAQTPSKTNGRVLPDLASIMATQEAMMAQIAALQSENEKLKARGDRKLALKVSVPTKRKDGTMTTGGALSVYGLGRFPVTLYRQQWVKLLDIADDIRAFIVEHDGELKVKE